MVDEDNSIEGFLARLFYLDDVPEYQDMKQEAIDSGFYDKFGLCLACGITMGIGFGVLRKKFSWSNITFGKDQYNQDITFRELCRRRTLLGRFITIYCNVRTKLKNMLPSIVIGLLPWETQPVNRKIQTTKSITSITRQSQLLLRSRYSLHKLSKTTSLITSKDQRTETLTDAAQMRSVKRVEPGKILDKEESSRKTNTDGDYSLTLKSEEISCTQNSEKESLNIEHNVEIQSLRQSPSTRSIEHQVERQCLRQSPSTRSIEHQVERQCLRQSPSIKSIEHRAERQCLRQSPSARSTLTLTLQLQEMSAAARLFHPTRQQLTSSQSLKNIVPEAEEGSTTRTDSMCDEKPPMPSVCLDSSTAQLDNPKMRSIFSRSKPRKRRFSRSLISSLSSQKDVELNTSCVRINPPSEQEDNKNTDSSGQKTDISQKLTHVSVKTHDMSQIPPDRPVQKPEKFQTKPDTPHKMPIKLTKWTDMSVKLLDMIQKKPEILTKYSHTQVKAAIPMQTLEQEQNVDAYNSSEKNQSQEHKNATRKRKRTASSNVSNLKPSVNVTKNDNSSTCDLSECYKRYQKCVGGTSIHTNVYEIYASETREELTKQTKIANESVQTSPLQTQVDIAPTNDQKETIKTNKLEFKNVPLTQIGRLKGHIPPATTFTKKTFHSATKRNSLSDIRPKMKRANEMSGSIKENIIRPCIKEIGVYPRTTANSLRSNINDIEKRTSIIENFIHASSKNNILCPSTKENYKKSSIPGNNTLQDNKKHCRKYSTMPFLHAQEAQQAKTLTAMKDQKSRLGQTNHRSESIRMVESLISMSVAIPTDNSGTLAVLDSSLSRSVTSKDEKSMDLSLSVSEADKKMSLNDTISQDLENISLETGDVRDVKKSLRFAMTTETPHKPDRQIVNLATPSPTAWSSFNKALKAIPETRQLDSKIGKIKKVPNPERKQIINPCDYPMLFDKLIRKSKNNIRNTLLLCKTAKTTMYEQLHRMKPQGPGSVRASKIRSRINQFPTLMSFLDHIEKEERHRKKHLKHAKCQHEHAIKEVQKTRLETPDDIKIPERAVTGNNRPEARNASLKQVSNDLSQKSLTSNFSSQSLRQVLLQPAEKSDTIKGSVLHFGTEELELYSESSESVCSQKEESKNSQGSDDMGAHEVTKFPSTERKISKSKNPETSVTSKAVTKILATTKKETKADYRVWKKDALQNMKKDLSEKVNNRAIKSLYKISSPLADTRHSAAENRHRTFSPGQNAQQFSVKPKTKLQTEHPRSLFAIPDHTRDSELIFKKDSEDNTGSDLLHASKECSSVTEGKQTKYKQMCIVENANDRRKFKVNKSIDHKSKPDRVLKNFKQSSPDKSCDFGENINPRGLNQPNVHDREGETLALSAKSKLFEIRYESIRKPPSEKRSVSNTPTRMKRRLQILEPSRLAEANSRPSGAARNKLLKDDRSRDTELSSTPKSVTFTDTIVTTKAHNLDVDHRSILPLTARKVSKDMIKCDQDVTMATSRSDIQTTKLSDVPLRTSPSLLRPRLPTSRRRGLLSSEQLHHTNLRRQAKPNSVCDRYLVHTAEFPHRRTAAQSCKQIEKAKHVDGELHYLSTDADAPAKSPEVIDSQMKPEAWHHSFSSYTSKHRANDITGKSVKSPWRGTVAFRKRLEHLLQHNKALQNKHRSTNSLVTKKTRCEQVSPDKLNSLPSKKDNLLSLYKEVTIGKVDQTSKQNIGKISHINLLYSKREQVKSIQSAGKSVSPVSRDLKQMQGKRERTTVGGKNYEYAAPSIKLPMRKKIALEQKDALPKVIPPVETGHYLDTAVAPTKTITESSKHILTHSDLFEQNAHKHFKKRAGKFDHKLTRTQYIRNITPAASEPKIGAPCKTSQDSLNDHHNSNLSSFEEIDHKLCNIRSTLSWPQRHMDIEKKNQMENVTAENKGNDMTKEHSKSTAGSLFIKSPVVSAVWRKQSCTDVVDQDNSEVVGIGTGVTRHSFPHNRKDLYSQNTDRAAKPISEEIETNARIIQTENNLQQLLDKIKQSCSLAITARKDKSKENESSFTALKERSSRELSLKRNKFDTCANQKQLDKENPLKPRPLAGDVTEVTEQSRSICTEDQKAVQGVISTQQKDTSPQSMVIKETIDVNTYAGSSNGVEGEVSDLVQNKDIKRVDGEHTTDGQGEIKPNVISNESCTRATLAQDSKTVVNVECTSKGAMTKIPKTKLPRIRLQVAPNGNGFQNKRNEKSTETATSAAEAKDKVIVSNVKHVVFELNNKSVQNEPTLVNMDHSEVRSQESGKGNSVLAYTQTSDMLELHVVQNLTQDKNGVHTRSVRDNLQTGNVPEKNISRQDAQTSTSLDTGHMLERQQSITSEVTCRVPSPSEQAALNIVSPTSFSQLQNSDNVEPGKLTAEVVVQTDIATDVQEQISLHSFINEQALPEFCDRFTTNSSQTTSFWKKDVHMEVHMDVIPEEVDYESGFDTYTDVNSAANKLSDGDTDSHLVEHTAVKTCKHDSPGTDNLYSFGKLDTDNEIQEKDEASLVQTELDKGSKDTRKTYSPTREVDGTLLEITGDEEKSSLQPTGASETAAFAIVTSATENGNLSILSQNALADRLRNLSDDLTNADAFSQIKDPEKSVNQDLQESQGFHKAVSATVSESMQKDKDSTLKDMNEPLSEQFPLEHKVSLTSCSNIEIAVVKITAPEYMPGEARDGMRSDEAQFCHHNDREQSNNLNTAIGRFGSLLNSSFTGETTNKEPRFSNIWTDSLSPVKLAGAHDDVLQNTTGIGSTDSQLQKRTINVLATSEVSQQPALVHKKDQHNLSYSPTKPAFYKVRGNLHSQNSPDISSNAQLKEKNSSFSKLAIKHYCKPHEQECTKLSDADQQGIIASSSNEIQESANSRTAQSLLSKFKKSNYEEVSFSNKSPEHSTKGNQKTPRVQPISPKKTNSVNSSSYTINTSCESKTHTKLRRFGSEVSATSDKGAVRIVSVDERVSDTQLLREGDRFRKSVSQQKGTAIVGKNVQTAPHSSPAGTFKHIDLAHEVTSQPSPSKVEAFMNDKVRIKCHFGTSKVSRTGCKGETPADQSDKQTEAQIQKQNLQVKKERNPTGIEKNKVRSPTAKDSRSKSVGRNANTTSDDLESLLNRELSQASLTGGLRPVYKTQRLFVAHGARARRRWKMKKISDQSIAELSNQRELHFHFLRENDGSLKGISSNTSQSTIPSLSEITMHHSSRPVRSLAPGRFTKLEEFLQKAEQSNRTGTTSNVSRAFSKLSSFTSVTPSSQEDEQLQPLQNPKDHRWKVNKFKKCASEPSDHRSHTPSKVSPTTVISTKSSRISTVQQPKSKQWQHITVPDLQQKENNRSGSKIRTCYISNPPSSQTCQNHGTPHNVCRDVNVDPCGSELANTKERTKFCTNNRNINDPEFADSAETILGTTCATTARDNRQQIRPVADSIQSPKQQKDETSVKSNIPRSEVVSSEVPPNISAESECPESTMSSVNVGISQTTEDSSNVSTSSSSIVLSWIGSDLGDIEETVVITQNLSDRYGTVYSQVSTQQNNSPTGTSLKDSERGLLLINTCTANAQQHEMECLSQDSYSTDIGKMWEVATDDIHSSVSRHVALKEANENSQKDTERTPARSSQKSDVKECSGRDFSKSAPCEDEADSRVINLNKNKDTWLTLMSFSGTEQIPDCQKKPLKCNNRLQLVPGSCYKCPPCEPELNPDTSKQTLKQFYVGSEHAREYTLEQPSYFNALLRDPKWNPYVDVREDKYNVDFYPDLSNFGGNYVQSAWTYQNTRNLSPTFSQQKNQQGGHSPVHTHSIKQQLEIYEPSTTQTASASQTLRPNIDSQTQSCNLESSVTNPRHSTTKMPAEKTVGSQCSLHNRSFRHNKEQLKQSDDVQVASCSKARSVDKQSLHLKKVHFDNNLRSSDKFPSTKQFNLSLTQSSEAMDSSKEKISLEEHLKASAKSGTIHSTERFPSKQQSRSTESTRTRTKVSLEQHLCSTLDTEKNLSSRSNETQPTSENGTTKSTSSHASLNWYKPQSLPSSTSVSNSNTTHQQQDTPGLSLAPLSESDTTPGPRRSNTESARRQHAQTAALGTSPGRNLPSSSPRNTQGMANNQRNTKFVHGTHRSSLIQTLTLNFAPELERGSPESLSASSSASKHGNDKRHIPGFRRLRESAASRATRQTLPPSSSGLSSRTIGRKSTRGPKSASDNSRGESKPVTTHEVTALMDTSCISGRSNGNVSNLRSSLSIQSNSQKNPEATRTTATMSHAAPGHGQVLKRTRDTAEGSTCQTPVRTSGENNSREITKMDGRQKLRHSSKSSRDSHVSESGILLDEDSAGVSSVKATKRVSRLVEMFEKKFES